MITIYEKTTGSLTALPGRSASTFPSGLIRVDQKYVCTTSMAATHRATLAVGNDMPDGNTAPATDGLKIFPAPQEIENGDGFTEFVVSAYGRTQTGLQGVTMRQERIITPAASYSVWKVTGSITVPVGTVVTIDDLSINGSLFEPFEFLTSNPALNVMSIEEVETVDASRNRVLQEVTIDGKTFSQYIPGPTRRKYRARMTSDGVTVASTIEIWLTDPVITITGSQSFGDFVEVSIATTRENTSPTIS